MEYHRISQKLNHRKLKTNISCTYNFIMLVNTFQLNLIVTSANSQASLRREECTSNDCSLPVLLLGTVLVGYLYSSLGRVLDFKSRGQWFNSHLGQIVYFSLLLHNTYTV